MVRNCNQPHLRSVKDMAHDGTLIELVLALEARVIAVDAYFRLQALPSTFRTTFE